MVIVFQNHPLFTPQQPVEDVMGNEFFEGSSDAQRKGGTRRRQNGTVPEIVGRTDGNC